MISKTIKSHDGIDLFYIISKKRKKAVFFIHGLACNHTFFKKEQKYLSQKLTTLSMDLRGHGKSGKPNTFSMDDFAKDIDDVLKKEKISSIVLIGHSLGGFIALKFAELFPKKVSSIILIDSSYKLSLSTIRPFFLIFCMLPCSIIDFVGWALHKRKPGFDFSKYHHNAQIVYYSTFVIDNPSMKACIKMMRAASMEGSLSKIKAPVLIIETKKDEIFNRFSYHFIHKKIENSSLDILPGRHAIPVQDPKTLDRSIKAFLEKP